jgi:acetylornithine deacetylase/succinyl-diaminopimelate desuccinylase-like protein
VDAAWLEELSEFLRIPSISADPAHAADVARAGEWVCERVRRAGGSATVVTTEASPLAIGDIPASSNADRAPTVLLYGHFDVQPPAPLDLWTSAPFEPTVDGEWLVARGVADDKGQLYMLLKAAELLAADGALPVNVWFACDGEEEIGGRTIADYLSSQDRRPDASVIFDTTMVQRGVPAIDVAFRGLAYLHVRVRTGERDLHSGIYGGAALNAAHALVQALGGVLPRDGRVPEPLRAGVTPPTDAELADWARLPSGQGELELQGARPSDGAAADEFYVRTWAEPALDVNGFESGSPHLVKTVLPVLAEANLSIRLAPGQSPKAIAPELERLLREAAPPGADVEVELQSAGAGAVIPADAPAVQLALDVFERTVGRRPLLVRSGGSLPIVEALGPATVITGFALPESNIHAPNERLLVEYIPLGVETARGLLTAFADLPTSA